MASASWARPGNFSFFVFLREKFENCTRGWVSQRNFAGLRFDIRVLGGTHFQSPVRGDRACGAMVSHLLRLWHFRGEQPARRGSPAQPVWHLQDPRHSGERSGVGGSTRKHTGHRVHPSDGWAPGPVGCALATLAALSLPRTSKTSGDRRSRPENIANVRSTAQKRLPLRRRLCKKN